MSDDWIHKLPKPTVAYQVRTSVGRDDAGVWYVVVRFENPLTQELVVDSPLYVGPKPGTPKWTERECWENARTIAQKLRKMMGQEKN